MPNFSHIDAVELLAAERIAADAAEMRKSSAVRAAADALETALRNLDADPTNSLLLEVVDECEKTYRDATNSYRRNQRLAALEQERKAKTLLLEEQQAAHAAQAEAEAKADMLAAWLARGGTQANFEQEWNRPGGLWAQELQKRAQDEQQAMQQRVARVTQNPGF